VRLGLPLAAVAALIAALALAGRSAPEPTTATPRPTQQKQSVDAGDDAGPPPVRPSGARVITGELRDDRSRPIEGASVSLRLSADPGFDPWTATSDEEGKFRIDGLPEAASLSLEAMADGHDDAERTLRPDDPDAVDLVLARRGELRVCVNDARGVPVPSANVYTTGTGLFPAAVAQTGKDGCHVERGLPGGRYQARTRLEARVGGPSPALSVAPGERAETLLVLETGATLIGRVRDAQRGSAVAGVTLRIEGFTPGLAPDEVKSDERGVFEAHGLFAGPARIEIVHEGFATFAATLTLPPKEPLEIALQGAARLIGQVLDTSGRPIKGASLSIATDEGDPLAVEVAGTELMPRGELGVTRGPVPPVPAFSSNALGNATSVARSDEKGQFDIAGLPPTPMRLVATRTGFAPSMVRVDNLEPHRTRDGLRIILRKGGTLEGRVVDGRGEPVEGVAITVKSDTGFEASALSDARGQYTITDLVGPVNVEAHPRGFAPLTCSAVVRADAVARCDLGLSASLYTLPVRVVDRRGFGLDGALVTLSARKRMTPQTHVSRSDGSLIFTELPAPPYAIEVRLRDHLSVRGLAVDRADAEVRITLERGARISGHVLDSLGRVVPSARVFSDDESASTRSDAAGAFLLDGVRPGSLLLFAEERSAGRGESREVRARAGETLPGVLIHLAGRYEESEISDDLDLDAETEEGAAPPQATQAAEPAPSEVVAPKPKGPIGLEQRGDATVVTHVSEGSFAARAGLRAGDALLSVDGEPVLSAAQARGMLLYPPGASGRVQIARGARKLTLRFKRPALR
jgi:hypothetical protein